jgi:hypothetical protein
MNHRVFHYEDASLLVYPADTNTSIMQECGFRRSKKYKNWVKRVSALSTNSMESTLLKIVKNVEEKTQIHLERYKYMPQKTQTNQSIARVFQIHNVPTEICEKIANTVSYNCRCKDNIVCLMCKHACCKKAQEKFCVCTLSFSCPDHGYRCIGSHD